MVPTAAMAMVGRGKEEEEATRGGRARRRASRVRGEREKMGDIGFGERWGEEEEEEKGRRL